MKRPIIWADCGAILGAVVGSVWAITDDFDTPKLTLVILTSFIYAVIWMSLGASTAVLVGMIEAKGITFSRLALGFVGAVVSASCLGLLWTVIGWVAEMNLLHPPGPWGVLDNGPNMSAGSDALSASLLGVTAAGISFLAWASVAMGRRQATWGLAVLIAAGACWLLSTRQLPVREDFRWNLKQREEVVALARAGKLAAYADPSAGRRWKVLPLRYRHLTDDGLVAVDQASGNTTVVFEKYEEGTCFSAFYYVADDHPPYGSWISLKKMAPHWFFRSECA